jgi:hypothetical protein
MSDNNSFIFSVDFTPIQFGLLVSKAQVQRVTESDLEFLMWFFILIHVYFVSIKVQIVFNSNKFIN